MQGAALAIAPVKLMGMRIAPDHDGGALGHPQIALAQFDTLAFALHPEFRDLGPALQLFRIESKRLKLSAPFGWRIAEPLDADAAGQATFYGRFNKIGCEEGERDGHIDLSNAALLASAKLSDRGHSTGDRWPPKDATDAVRYVNQLARLVRGTD